MCGDSTSKADVERLMGTEKADLVFTDPPYGMGKEIVGVANDNLNPEKLINFNRCWMNNAFAALQDNGSLYCWGTDESCMNIYAEIILPMARSGEVTFRNLITWWKGEGGLGIGGENLRCYPSHSEKCLFVMKGNKGFATLKDYKIPFCEELLKRFSEHDLTPESAAERICGTNRRDDEKKLESRVHAFKRHLVAPSMFNKPKKEYWQLWFGSMDGYDDFCSRYELAKENYRRGFNYFDATKDKCGDTWHIPSVSVQEKRSGGNHPTVKPLRLCNRAIMTSCPENGIVLDLFGGSGSTLISCETLQRRCRVMEIDPEWCKVIIRRWRRFKGME